jgi:hypothetical protein
MAKYLVVRPWNSEIKVGEVVEFEKLHPSLKSHVQLMPESQRQLEVSTPEPEPRRRAEK